MELTRAQEQGLKIAIKRYKNKEPYTCISGYAGVGKSTLVKFLISALKLNPYEVAYVAFTGKAASVLQHKGCPNATTAHKLLYYSKKKPNGRFIFTPRKKLENPYNLIVVDEISMLPVQLWELLLSHHIHIIALGDPFQLPPINKKTDNHVLDNPHIFLDEIVRQAKESSIIRLTMDIRDFKAPAYQKNDDLLVLPQEELVDGMYSWADEIITATNRKRLEINSYIRKEEGRGEEPEDGDKVICCRNCWNILDEWGEYALTNGTIGYLKNPRKGVQSFSMLHKFPDVPVIYTDLETEDGELFTDLIIDYQALKEGKPFLTPEQSYQLYKTSDLRNEEPIEFNYGSAITCHRAQGSTWNNILVVEERFPFGVEEHARWLYTACTRPASKLVLLR